jgi:hypothetical protein
MMAVAGDGKFAFPSGSDLNVRLRRIITGYQRSHKKRMQKEEQFAKVRLFLYCFCYQLPCKLIF